VVKWPTYALASTAWHVESVLFGPTPATSTQNGVHKHMVHKCLDMLQLVDTLCDPVGVHDAIAKHELAAKSCSVQLVADAVDMPPNAATCDPLPLLGLLAWDDR
jgi:hypothetical protein